MHSKIRLVHIQCVNWFKSQLRSEIIFEALRSIPRRSKITSRAVNMIMQTANRNRYQALQSSGFTETSVGYTWVRTWWTLQGPGKLEVECEKWLFRTYICAIIPRYRDNMYMYLTIVGRALAGVSLSDVGRRIFEPTSKCKYTQNEYSKSIPIKEKLEPPLFHISNFSNW